MVINNYINNSYNKLRFDWKNCSQELSELKKIEKIAFKCFYNALMKEVNKHGLESPFSAKKEKHKKKDSIVDEDEFKKAFRDVAKQCHPDATRSDSYEVFNKLIEAKDSGDFATIIDIGKKESVDIDELTISHLDMLEKNLEDLEAEINEIRGSIHWLWYHENNNNRNFIISNIINQMKKTKK